VAVMLIHNSIILLRETRVFVGRICRHLSVHTHSLCTSRISRLLLSLRLRRFCTPYQFRWLTFNSSDSSSTSDGDADELCVYQPDVRRIRIVTMNDVQEDDIMQDAALSHSSVQRDTIYTRHHVSADDPTVQSLFRGVCEGSRSALARAITLIESVHPKRRAEAQVLLREVLEYSRKKRQHSLHRVNSFRIGNCIILMTAMMVITDILFTVVTVIVIITVISLISPRFCRESDTSQATSLSKILFNCPNKMSLSSLPVSATIAPSLFHSRLIAYLFNESFPPYEALVLRVLPSQIIGLDQTNNAHWFIFTSLSVKFSVLFHVVSRLSWLSVSFFTARIMIVSYSEAL